MKRKHLILAALLLSALLAAWLLARPAPLCSMRRTCAQPENLCPRASFSGEAGGRIRFILSTRAESGSAAFTLYDEAGAAVQVFGQADFLATYVTLPHSGTYTLEANCDRFAGRFSAAVYRAD